MPVESSTSVPVSRTEISTLLVITAIAFAARFAFLDELAVEHFDEGVYASNLWFPDEGYQYPDRFLYAPPLVPSLIEWCMILFGQADWSPFLPSLILGSLTAPLAWWSVRRWSNAAAGTAAAALIALNDFHIAMSRSALTDAPMVFLVLLSVWLTIEALADCRLRLAAAAGIATGLAWATKYNGWLPLAIAVSGTAGAWLFQPRKVHDRKNTTSETNHFPLASSAVCLAVMTLTAALVWSPVWWELQSVGGYSRVAENHQNYITGFDGWWNAIVRHEAVQRHYAGWLTMLSGWLAVISAAVVLRVERSTWNVDSTRHGHDVSGSTEYVKRSTWNDADSATESSRSSASLEASEGNSTRVARSTWNDADIVFRIAVAGSLAGAIVLSPLIATTVWALTDLIARVLKLRRETQNQAGRSATQATGSKRHSRSRSTPAGRSDKIITPPLGPRRWFGCWLHLAWLCGLLLATPLYRPYPRLLLPLLCVSCLATGLAIVRLLCGRLVSRESHGTVTGSETASATTDELPLERKTSGPEQVSAPEPPTGHSHRMRGGLRFIWLVPVVCLCVWRAMTCPSGAWQNRSTMADVAEEAIAAASSQSANSPGATAVVKYVMYVYGEPGLLFHLPRDGVPVQPVMDLSFAMPGSDHPRIPTFVLAGPHAWKSPQFGEQFRSLPDGSLLEVAEFSYRVSDFVLLDDHSPEVLSKHRNDAVKLFRVQFR